MRFTTHPSVGRRGRGVQRSHILSCCPSLSVHAAYGIVRTVDLANTHALGNRACQTRAESTSALRGRVLGKLGLWPGDLGIRGVTRPTT